MTRRRSSFAVPLLALIGFAGCGDASAPPPLEVAAEDSFVDLGLALRSSGEGRIEAAATHGGRTVAFGAEFGPGTVTLVSLGAESDAFVQTLGALYGADAAPAAMAARTQFSAVALEGDPARLDAGPVKLKLFYEPPAATKANEDEEDPDYAELFLNVDAAAKRVEFHDKDPEYHDALLRALGR